MLHKPSYRCTTYTFSSLGNRLLKVYRIILLRDVQSPSLGEQRLTVHDGHRSPGPVYWFLLCVR